MANIVQDEFDNTMELSMRLYDISIAMMQIADACAIEGIRADLEALADRIGTAADQLDATAETIMVVSGGPIVDARPITMADVMLIDTASFLIQ